MDRCWAASGLLTSEAQGAELRAVFFFSFSLSLFFFFSKSSKLLLKNLGFLLDVILFNMEDT